MNIAFDTYTLQARLTPVLIAVFPVAIALATWLPGQSATWNLLGTVILSFGLTVLLAQVGRDRGKRKEPELFASWGGVPTTRMLSYQRTSLDRFTLNRYHDKLKTLVPELTLPGPQEERQNPSEANRVYESSIRYLREKTRDQAKFPLVFAENVNYGFRRNLWAMKPIGLPAAILGIIGCVSFATRNWSAQSASLFFSLVGLAINVIFLLLWIFLFKPNWVRVAAEAYAERLLGSLDTM
jgi:hypothetical protein